MSKLQLLAQISEADIVKHYLPDFQVGSSLNYRSPFAEKDDHPSLNFYEKDGKLLFKSHNTGHQGDVFQFVADLKGIDCKANFNGLIEEITKDIGIAMPRNNNQSQSLRISYDRKGSEMLEYFQNLGVPSEVLTRYNVRQVKFHEFVTRTGKHCKFDYKSLKNVAIGYDIEGRVKVYFPEIAGVQTRNFGFKDQTTSDIFGLAQLPTQVPRLFVAAGEKDCLVLNAKGFHAISFQSENTQPTDDQLKKLNTFSKDIFILFDTDEAGKKAAEKLSIKTGWKVVALPDAIKDASDYFQSKTISDFETLVNRAGVSAPTPEAPKVYTIFHQTEEYLQKRYDFRYNTVSLDIEASKKGARSFQPVNENNLFVELNKAGVKVGMDKLICILKSNFVPHYNPVSSYFKGLPKWDGKEDHIANLAMHLHAEQPTQMHTQFKKWLVRSVRCAIEPGYFNKQAFILVHSEQNSGKTSFCRFLCPPDLGNYIAENISDDKDSRIALVKNFLINLDELSSLARHEINSLKAVFSKDFINERLPYDRKNSIIPRIANFIGSTNMAEFLADETGSVRWLCFEIHKIDWGYRQTVDINKVWAQAYTLYTQGFQADMSSADITENEGRNAKFQQRSNEAEVITRLLRPSDSHDPLAEFMTTTLILEYLTIHTPLKMNVVMVGRAMPQCGFKKAKDSKTDRYGYYCIKLK